MTDDPPRATPEELALQPTTAMRCGAVRYGVICTLPAGHDGMHRHDPGDARTQLSWQQEP